MQDKYPVTLIEIPNSSSTTLLWMFLLKEGQTDASLPHIYPKTTCLFFIKQPLAYINKVRKCPQVNHCSSKQSPNQQVKVRRSLLCFSFPQPSSWNTSQSPTPGPARHFGRKPCHHATLLAWSSCLSHHPAPSCNKVQPLQPPPSQPVILRLENTARSGLSGAASGHA